MQNITFKPISASTQYFYSQRNKTLELETTYLAHFYRAIASDFYLAHGDDIVSQCLQQKEHIDAVIQVKGKFLYCEHKFDSFKPGLEARQEGRNILIELVMNERLKSPGWLHTSHMDYLLYCFERPIQEQCLEVYVFDWCLLKAWFVERQHQYRQYTNARKPTSPTTFSIVPIADIQRAMPVEYVRIHASGRIETLPGSTSVLHVHTLV